MERLDRARYIERYEGRLKEFGYSPQTLGWGKNGRQEVRFSVLAEPILRMPESSVLDVGCGFADLYDYLAAHGWRGTYHGIDLVPGLVDVARERRPGVRVEVADIAELSGDGAYDFVCASGIFNARLEADDNAAHIERSVGRMFALSRVAACVDFMTTYVDFQHPTAWHTDPCWALGMARRLSARFVLRSDYMPFEYALLLYRRDEWSPRNVFTDFAPDPDAPSHGEPERS